MDPLPRVLPPHYAVPRALGLADRFLPFFTTAQLAWTLAGAVLGALGGQAPLPATVRWWLVLYLPLAGVLAKRTVWGRWDGLATVCALGHYALRPKRCVYAPIGE